METSHSRLYRWPTAALLAFANVVIGQSLKSPRHPISELDIAKELGAIGVIASASQVHVPAQMNAAVSSPTLEIVTAQPVGEDKIRLELRCSAAGECLPFFATLDVKDASLASAEIRSQIGNENAPGHNGGTRSNTALPSQPRLRVGSHAVMTIRDSHLSIHLQVLAIDDGTIGQEVRVCTLDRKKVFHATVTGEATVTGTIE